jgi:erythromycin esterase
MMSHGHILSATLVTVALVVAIGACDDDLRLTEPDVATITISILSPADDSSYMRGAEILFELLMEGNTSEPTGIAWESSIDGEFGSGRKFWYDSLSVGAHVLTVEVGFPDGTRQTTSGRIHVHEIGSGALVRIVAPRLDSLWFYQTDAHQFSSLATDSEGRTSLPRKSTDWRSDVDGIVSNRPKLSVQSLSLGVHTLILTVTFHDNSVGSDTLSDVLIIEDPWRDTDLLNDRQLESPPDPSAPSVRSSWANWVKDHLEPIRSLTSADYSDLTFLGDNLEGKTIVQLGEVAHGIEEQNSLRVRLIKYLHQWHGFTVVAFESGLFPCYMANRQIGSTDPKESLFGSLNSAWKTPAVLDLFAYIKQTHTQGNPLILAGFDIYPTGTLSLNRPQFLMDLAMPFDSSLARSIHTHDQVLIQHWTDRQHVEQYMTANYEALVEDYDRLNRLLADSLDVLRDRHDDEELLVALEVGRSVRSYVRHRAQVLGIEEREPDNERDQQMARTVQFLKETLYPDQKMIVWAHNLHVYEDTRAIQGPRYGTLMGSFLNSRYGDELYTMVSLSYRGRIDYGVVSEIEIIRNESIEAILFQGRLRHFFLSTDPWERVAGTEWMYTLRYQTYIHSTGTYYIRYVPIDQFDAVLFVDTVSRPQFLY